MARRISRQSSAEKKQQQAWWVPVVIALVLLGLSYGFASWAIDSGRLTVYALTFIFLYFGVSYLVRGIRQAVTR
jgi:predicted tellurium resistance membrane protein TerC